MFLASPAICFIAESQFGLKNGFGFGIIIQCFKRTETKEFIFHLMTAGFDSGTFPEAFTSSLVPFPENHVLCLKQGKSQ